MPLTRGGESTQPLELGNLVVQMKIKLNLGDAAPDFTVKTVDGATLRLADYRGKYVLLDFWATWCGPCVRETPNLKAVFDAYGTNGNFAMISLSLDKTPDLPATYARTNGLNWAQGFLGDWSEATLPARYGVEGIPTIFLLGPDGKMLALDLRGEQILPAVREVLGGR
jgi:thiol-disulfide isomerase/thioredoxin